MTLSAQPDHTPLPEAPHLRHAPVLLTVFIGVLVSIGVFALVRTWETERVAREFQWRAESRARTIEHTLRSYEECLYSMRDVFHATHSVSAEAFRKAATAQLGRHPGLVTLEWLPLIHQSQRAPTERVVQETWPTWFIRDRVDSTTPSGSRTEYLPVLYCEPMSGRETTLGTDQFLGNYQRAIQRAMETGLPSATRRVPMEGEADEPFGISILLVVYLSAPEPTMNVQSRDRIRGFVRGVFSLRELALNTALTNEPGAVDLVLHDQTPAGTEPLLFNVIGGDFGSTPSPSAAEMDRGLHAKFPIACGGRDWVLHARPGQAWLAARKTFYPGAFFAIGLCFTALIVSRQLQRQRRDLEVEQLVQTRTEQLRRTQEKLAEDVRMRLAAEERYRAFVSQSTEAIWHFEIEPPMPLSLSEEEQIRYVHEHAVMAECNDACARMYGRKKADEMTGTRLSEIMLTENPATFVHLRDYVRKRFRLVDSESHEIDRDGNTHIFRNNVIGIIEGEKLVRAWGTQRDITEQRRFEEARAESEKRLRLAMAAASVGTWEWDRKADRFSWSEQLNEVLGTASGETGITFTAYLERVHPEDRERVAAVIQQAQADGAEFECEYRIAHPSGETRWVATRGDVRRGANGEILGLLGATLDATARKLAEEEHAKIEQRLQDAQKLESLGVLAGGIAHDFNNLLTGILGNASLARMDLAPSSPVQQSLVQIEQASQRAADLCKQMLAYSGKGRFIVQTVDLSQLVEDTAPLLQVSVSKGAVLKFRLGRELPAVNADVTQIRQILMNLVINASDALDGRSGVIEIATGVMHADAAYLTTTHLSPAIPEGDYVFLEVSDNGSGMSADTQKRIFDPFFTTKFTGRGLGLAAVLGIVRGHKGALKVYSELGRGSTFKLLLPATESLAEPLRDETDTAGAWRGSGVVLVIDDEETVRMAVTGMLRTFGFDPLVVASGREAIDVFRSQTNSVVAVMLDLTMPQMDGAETFTELRRLKPDVKVLLMSGFNEQDAINRFAGKGLAGFVQKPFKPETLRSKLRAMLG